MSTLLKQAELMRGFAHRSNMLGQLAEAGLSYRRGRFGLALASAQSLYTAVILLYNFGEPNADTHKVREMLGAKQGELQVAEFKLLCMAQPTR